MMDRGPLRTAILVAAATLTSGCATVKQDQFDQEMAQLRAEMSQGDSAVAGRVDALGARVDQLNARMDRLQGALSDLESEMDATVQRFEASLRFVTPIRFAFDDATVDGEGEEILTRFASVLRDAYPGAMVTVEGFTDPAGSEAYNLRLGQRRADAVRTVLVDELGLSGEQVRAISYGEDTRRLVAPGASGPGASGAANRRVALVVDHPGGSQSIVTQEETTDVDR